MYSKNLSGKDRCTRGEPAQMIRHCIDHVGMFLQTVSDPEIPVLSVVDLGMIRGV